MPDPLTSHVVSAHGAGRDLRDRLFALYDAAYSGGSREQFDLDLAEKDWVILLKAGTSIAGFSTQKVFEVAHDGARLRILFSGDTIIDRAHWGSQELVRAWCRFAGAIKGQDPSTKLFWYLISKGHRTYLYLPFFFETFYPSPDTTPPARVRALMDRLGESRYGVHYDKATGLIQGAAAHDRLRSELDAAPRRDRNRHVAFFLERNPRYAEGVELLCLAEIAAENMRGVARRELERGIADGQRELAG